VVTKWIRAQLKTLGIGLILAAIAAVFYGIITLVVATFSFLIAKGLLGLAWGLGAFLGVYALGWYVKTMMNLAKEVDE